MTSEALTLKDKIMQLLRECNDILSRVDIPTFSDELKKSEARLMQPMQLAIIGKISSSKSTLVNAILGKEEVVKTGQMEETFNVSWLKYGDSNSNINVFFKNGDIKSVPRSDWAKWTSHQEKNVLKEQVKFIEVFYNHEILKRVNIIDTPGLLDRPVLEMNDIELNALIALEHLADAILFIFDASETCGFTLESQFNLFVQIEKVFNEIPIIALFKVCRE